MKRLSLQHRLRNRKVQLNNTIGENVYLKTKIDIMRQEIMFAADAIKAMTETINALKKDSTACNEKSVPMGRIANETNN